MAAHHGEPSAQAVYNAARSLAEVDEPAAAVSLYQLALSLPGTLNTRQRQAIESFITDHGRRLGEVRVGGQGWVKLLPGVFVQAPVSVYLGFGEKRLWVGSRLDELAPARIQVSRSNPTLLTIGAASPPISAVRPNVTQASAPTAPVWKQPWFLIGTSVSLLSLGSAIGLGAKTLDVRDAYVDDGALSPSMRDRALGYRNATNVAWGVFAASLAVTAGYALWGTDAKWRVDVLPNGKQTTSSARTGWIAGWAVSLRGRL